MAVIDNDDVTVVGAVDYGLSIPLAATAWESILNPFREADKHKSSASLKYSFIDFVKQTAILTVIAITLLSFN